MSTRFMKDGQEVSAAEYLAGKDLSKVPSRWLEQAGLTLEDTAPIEDDTDEEQEDESEVIDDA